MPLKDKLSDKQKRKLYSVLDILPDKVVIQLQYYAALGRRLNLKNPKRFTEKIEWYKLNYKDPLMTTCADKYKIRSYVEDRNYEEYMPKLYGIYDIYDEMNFEQLPNSFVIKANNGSGTNIIIKNKKEINFNKIEEIVRSWYKVNTLSIGREWAYKDIEPKILTEELLTPEDEFQQKHGLNDYKILCFDGKAELIWIDVDRENNHRRNFFDLNWNQLDVISDKPLFEGEIEKPFGINKMIEIANEFSKDFPFVRVDFYSLNNHIYIGELTFYPWSGTVQFTPDEFDFELGSYFKLPTKVKEVNPSDER